MSINPDEARIMMLFANIKRTKKLDLNQAIKYINLSKADLKDLIYDLIGENKISGKTEGDVFIIESDIDKFVKLLEEKFIK
ncbi:MAG: hypothetical protein ACFFCM_11240 [Promethearchaeota archaeon]